MYLAVHNPHNLPQPSTSRPRKRAPRPFSSRSAIYLNFAFDSRKTVEASIIMFDKSSTELRADPYAILSDGPAGTPAKAKPAKPHSSTCQHRGFRSLVQQVKLFFPSAGSNSFMSFIESWQLCTLVGKPRTCAQIESDMQASGLTSTVLSEGTSPSCRMPGSVPAKMTSHVAAPTRHARQQTS